ncbi:MAG TPA: thiosulfate oxidation carrier protein SoxY [Usitatibacter sp.]|jgi:sulfur-oxidizing protein SoxY|nr:thiosulfate oxidation carrier protein SoxY [Usitatibacter sp.]
MRRRDFLAAGAAAIVPIGAAAQEVHDIDPFVNAITSGVTPEQGGIEIELPQIAENGHSVPLTVRVASPMNELDHVTAVHVIAERNPRPAVASFHLGPWSGRAEVSTRIRLAGTQKLTVVAALSGNRFRIVKRPVAVASAACIDEASL